MGLKGEEEGARAGDLVWARHTLCGPDTRSGYRGCGLCQSRGEVGSIRATPPSLLTCQFYVGVSHWQIPTSS